MRGTGLACISAENFAMTRFSIVIRATALAAVALTASVPAFAKNKAVTVPATVFRTADSKLCMGAEAVGIKVAKGQPRTMCLTRADWEAQGVTINLK